jgi:hypothetical protein
MTLCARFSISAPIFTQKTVYVDYNGQRRYFKLIPISID